MNRLQKSMELNYLIDPCVYRQPTHHKTRTMGIYLQNLPYDQMFTECPNPLVVNFLSDLTHEERNANDNRTGTVQIGEYLNTSPRCECGKYRGAYYADDSFRCELCSSAVVNPSSSSSGFDIWLKQPIGVSPFIKLNIVYMLRHALLRVTSQQFDILSYIINQNFRQVNLPKTVQPIIDTVTDIIAANGGKRGYNQFIDNFFKYIELFREHLLEESEYVSDLYKLIDAYNSKNNLFSQYLPLPNKNIIVQERTGNGADMQRIFMDPTLARFFGIIKSVRGIDHVSSTLTAREKERRVALIVMEYTGSIVEYIEKFIGSKPGIFRRNLSGSRCEGTGRAVTSGMSAPHEYDEYVPPWAMFITNYQCHIRNKLIKRGYSMGEILCMEQTMPKPILTNKQHAKWFRVFNEIVDEILQQAPNRELPWFENRNPSLIKNSTQVMFVRQVNRDPEILSAGHPMINVRGFNADFDGDAHQFAAIWFNSLYEKMKGLTPHTNYFSMSRPFEVSNAFNLTAPVAINAASYEQHIREFKGNVNAAILSDEQRNFLLSVMV